MTHDWAWYEDHHYCTRCGRRWDGPLTTVPSDPCPGGPK